MVSSIGRWSRLTVGLNVTMNAAPSTVVRTTSNADSGGNTTSCSSGYIESQEMSAPRPSMPIHECDLHASHRPPLVRRPEGIREVAGDTTEHPADLCELAQLEGGRVDHVHCTETKRAVAKSKAACDGSRTLGLTCRRVRVRAAELLEGMREGAVGGVCHAAERHVVLRGHRARVEAHRNKLVQAERPHASRPKGAILLAPQTLEGQGRPSHAPRNRVQRLASS
eukprot:79282-Prymnesium_polylepis.3